jgi:hypothetical protein
LSDSARLPQEAKIGDRLLNLLARAEEKGYERGKAERGDYDKGFADGYAAALDEIADVEKTLLGSSAQTPHPQPTPQTPRPVPPFPKPSDQPPAAAVQAAVATLEAARTGGNGYQPPQLEDAHIETLLVKAGFNKELAAAGSDAFAAFNTILRRPQQGTSLKQIQSLGGLRNPNIVNTLRLRGLVSYDRERKAFYPKDHRYYTRMLVGAVVRQPPSPLPSPEPSPAQRDRGASGRQRTQRSSAAIAVEERKVLEYVARHPGCGVSEIKRAVDAPNFWAPYKLEKRGQLEQRGSGFHLTEAGQRELERAAP